MQKQDKNLKAKIEELLEQGVGPSEIAKTLGIESYKVHNAKYAWKKAKNVAAYAKLKTTAAPTGEITPNACIAITVDPEHVVALKLRNPDLQGTLYVSKNGVAYSKPNAKLKPTEFMSFELLAKLVESGVFNTR